MKEIFLVLSSIVTFVFRKNYRNKDKRILKEKLKHKELNEIKSKINILIIDDKKFDLQNTLKKEGWNVIYLKDLDRLEDPNLKSAHIVCIDIMGVGQKMGISQEGGQGLVKIIKDKYPEKKIILYSSKKEQDIFNEALDLVDKRVYKDGQKYPFISAIEDLSREISDWGTMTDFMYKKINNREIDKSIFIDQLQKILILLINKQSEKEIEKILNNIVTTETMIWINKTLRQFWEIIK